MCGYTGGYAFGGKSREVLTLTGVSRISTRGIPFCMQGSPTAHCSAAGTFWPFLFCLLVDLMMACGDFLGLGLVFLFGEQVVFCGCLGFFCFYFQNIYFPSKMLQSFHAIMDRSVLGNAETSFE